MGSAKQWAEYNKVEGGYRREKGTKQRREVQRKWDGMAQERSWVLSGGEDEVELWAKVRVKMVLVLGERRENGADNPASCAW